MRGCLLVVVVFVALIASCTGACAAHTKFTMLEPADFEADVRDDLAQGSSPRAAFQFLAEYRRGHLDDVRDLRWNDELDTSTDRICLSKPCSPFDLSAPADSRVLGGYVDTGQIYPWSWFCVEGYQFWLVFDARAGFTDVITKNSDRCL